MKWRIVAMTLVAVVNGTYLDLFEGDLCGTNDEWTCKDFNECPTAIQLQRERKLDVCSFDTGQTIVCCEPTMRFGSVGNTQPPPHATKPESEWTVSETMCAKYSESVKEVRDDPIFGPSGPKQVMDHCAWKREVLVSGGVDAKQGEYPHMVEIGYGTAPKEQYKCGGSLISERWVVSAAHCSRLEYRTETGTQVLIPKIARMGDVAPHDDSDHVKPVKFKIVKIINHPQYRRNRGYHDIALYKLSSDVTFSPHIRPICLQVDDPPPISRTKPPTAIGFGDTGYGTRLLELRLQKVNLTIISTQLCSKSFGVRSDLPTGISGDTMICAGDSGTTGKDTCQGDSGSSLQIRLDSPYCMHSLIGVTSFGKFICGGEDTTGVYTKVSYYVPWIEDIVWPAEKAKWKVDKMNKATNVHFPSG